MTLSMTKKEIKEHIQNNLKTIFCKTINEASNEEIYQAVAYLVRDIVADNWIATREVYKKKHPKTLYYLSMEFLMGRFLGNTLINLSMEKNFKKALEELGVNYNLIEEAERDPGLGNGGLGRLAACFLDSLSTLELPAYGCGIRYHYGIFKQSIENGYQVEKSDNWLENGDSWGVKHMEFAQEIKFGGKVSSSIKPDGGYKFFLEDYQTVVAIPYDYPVVGFNNNTVNTLRLWDAEAKNKFDLQSFNAGNYSKAVEEQNLAATISEVLYPADEHIHGKELRLKQQYFFISASLQQVVKEFHNSYKDFNKLPQHVAFQLNDTHPSMAVAELMRILVDDYDLPWDDAWAITKKTCAYTNHTIMSEALEKWPTELFSHLLPRVYMIIEEINKRFCNKLTQIFGNNPEKLRKMAIIADGQVRMAHLAIVGSHSVNGVAQLHTDILKYRELNDFFDIFPERFNNKTNGITQRRWLAHCNPNLAELINKTIGNGYLTDLTQLKQLENFLDDKSFCDKFMKVKRKNKISLSNFIHSQYGILIDPDSIFDIQVKRLHEYKRQLLNILHVLDLYNKIKINPALDIEPHTFIFSAKSAANYYRAKLIIKLINNVANLVNNDKTVNSKLKVLFLPNYCVSLAEKLIPAADVSEQISTASKEASGTGNMKFMLNGALTLGTLDGANVEILEEVGEENIFIFGLNAEQVMDLYTQNNYNPWDLFNKNQSIRMVMNQLINGELSNDRELFRELYESLLNGCNGQRADEYFILKDFDSYSLAHEKVNEKYKNKELWTKSAIINVANSGKFSSDRTILEYANEIWDLKSIHIKK
jgi:glycogen/starch/alpha-glucan phosphorylases